MTRALIPALGLLAACSAQVVEISALPADATGELLKSLTGRKTSKVQMLTAFACPTPGGATSVTGGSIYVQAIREGYAPVVPSLAGAVISATVQHNKRWYALEAIRLGSIIGAGLGGGQIVSMSAAKLSALIILHQVGDELSARIAERIPNPGPLVSSLLDPNGSLDLQTGCKTATILATPKGKL